MISNQTIAERVQFLQAVAEKQQAELNATLGQLRECQHWYAVLNAPSEVNDVNRGPALRPEVDSPLQRGEQ